MAVSWLFSVFFFNEQLWQVICFQNSIAVFDAVDKPFDAFDKPFNAFDKLFDEFDKSFDAFNKLFDKSFDTFAFDELLHLQM